jgi:bacteriocin-like protein
MKKQNDLAKIDDLQIEPLSDEELEAVSGGAAAASTSCSCCVATATVHTQDEKVQQ